MAPVENNSAHDVLEQQLKDTIQDLYQIMLQITTYTTTPTHTSSTALTSSLQTLTGSLRNVHETALAGAPPPDPLLPPPPPEQLAAFNMPPGVPPLRDPNVPLPPGAGGVPGSLPSIPPELVQYVENGRNPDIYTREFVEAVRRANQLVKGKMAAFGKFRDVLAGEIGAALPEVGADVARVVEMTSPEGGGEVKTKREGEGATT